MTALAAETPVHEQLFEHARALYRKGVLDEAEQVARQAIWAFPPVASPRLAGQKSRAWFVLGVIEFDQDRFGSALDCFAEALALNPSEGQNHAGQALAWTRLEMHEKAASVADRAVTLAPADPFVQNAASGVYREAKHFDRAIAAAAEAVRLAPQNTKYGQTLAQAFQYGGERRKAIPLLAELAAKEPRNAIYQNNLGVVLDEDCQYEAAVEAYDKCLWLDDTYAAATWNRSLIHLLLGNYAEGWAGHEARFSAHKSLGEARIPVRFAHPQWRPDRSRERVHVHAEQGFGDTLQFCRYLPLIAERADVHFEVPPGLVRLMAHNFPDVTVIQQAADWPGCLGIPYFDSHLSLMSAPYVFGTTVETIPSPRRYLTAIEGDIWFPPDGVNVGLCWYSGRRNTSLLARIGARKSLAFDFMRPLLEIGGMNFHSLQIGGDDPGHPNLRDDIKRVRDWADTAEIIEHLDLVISADTAVAHLAGAMGKPVWLLNPFETSWRWHLDRADSPWYSSMRIFRQKTPGDWAPVIAEVADALKEL